MINSVCTYVQTDRVLSEKVLELICSEMLLSYKLIYPAIASILSSLTCSSFALTNHFRARFMRMFVFVEVILLIYELICSEILLSYKLIYPAIASILSSLTCSSFGLTNHFRARL